MLLFDVLLTKLLIWGSKIELYKCDLRRQKSSSISSARLYSRSSIYSSEDLIVISESKLKI